MASIRLLARVLVALVALYAANDGLLQPFAAQGDGLALRQVSGHAAMPLLAAQAAEDDRDVVPLPGGDGAAALESCPHSGSAQIGVVLRADGHGLGLARPSGREAPGDLPAGPGPSA